MRNISDTISRLSKLTPGTIPTAGQMGGAMGGKIGQAMANAMSGLGGGSAGSDRLGDLTGFGSNPGALNARIHVPTDVKPGAALVVALHGCTQTAAAYDHGTGWSALADAEGFVVLFPEQTRSNNPNTCFNWFDSADIRRSGGEAESIAQMIAATVSLHAVDPARIFVTGLSAGGAMTAVMLATHPELFAAGAIIGGLPFASAAGVSQALDRMRGHGLATDDSAAASIRAAGNGATAWPRVAIWHGSADATVLPANMDSLTGQWREIHGLPEAPTRTESGPRWERSVWQDESGRDAVEQWSVSGMGHGVPVDAAALGHAGPYMLDVGLSSTLMIARSWGLTTRDALPRPAAATGAEPSSASSLPAGVQATIDGAMRAAGLMR